MIRLFALLIAATLFAACFGAPAHAYSVEDIRVIGNGAPTRVTIWTDEKLDHDVFLEGDTARHALVLDLGGAGWAPPPASDTLRGGIASYDWADGRLRLNMDRPMMVSRILDLPPAGSESRHRIIIDLDTVAPVRFARAAANQKRQLDALYARAAPHPAGLVPRRGAQRFVIVIDPGHGGKDPGAGAIGGGVEKTVVLAAAHQLKAILDKDPRYEVRLTRSDDTFIELEDRVTLARNWGADLFISLHADAAGSPSVEGASVYTISQRGEARVDREAAENGWDLPIEDNATAEVGGILSDLLKRETKSISQEFAERLLPELAKAGPVLRNTHRKAGLFVLLAPDVPAVLVEIGFLTNRADADRLRSSTGRQRAVAAIARAIDQHFDQQEQLLAQN